MPDTEMPHSRIRRHRFRGLRQVIGWGFSAAFSVGVLVIVSQQETGDVRLELPFGAPARAVVKAQKPTQPAIQTPPSEAKADVGIQRIAAEVRQLTANSKQLKARIASLESHLNDVTGSIERRAAVPVPVSTVTTPAPTLPLTSAPAMSPKLASIALPPSGAQTIIEPLAMPPAQYTDAHWPDPSATKATIKAEPKPAASTAGPVPSTVPMPRARPIRIASAAACPRSIAPSRPELGVDVGGAMNVSRLNEQWTAMKANFAPALAGLYPIVGRDRHSGHIPYRLLIGPVPSVAAATRLCANLIRGLLECRPARFEGEQLAQH